MREKPTKYSIRNRLRDGASEAENRGNIAESNLRRQGRLNTSILLNHAMNITNRRADEAKAIGQSEAAQRRGE